VPWAFPFTVLQFKPIAMKNFVIPFILLLAGAILGLLSAQYLMERTNVSAQIGSTGWTEVRPGGDDLKSTYLSGHFLSRGQVPPPKGTRFFARTSDDEGNSLRGDCLVTMEGKIPPVRWWLASATTSGARSTIDAGQAIREMSGETAVSISISPVPGNWMIPPSDGAYELQLMLLGVDGAAADAAPVLPKVRRLWC
jgi:hypothetical protein